MRKRRAAIHWIGGVSTARTRYLAGWPCCCSGARCEALAANNDVITRIPDNVTCAACLKIMARDLRAP